MDVWRAVGCWRSYLTSPSLLFQVGFEFVTGCGHRSLPSCHGVVSHQAAELGAACPFPKWGVKLCWKDTSSHTAHEGIHCDRRSLRPMTMPDSKKASNIYLSGPSKWSISKYAKICMSREGNGRTQLWSITAHPGHCVHEIFSMDR